MEREFTQGIGGFIKLLRENIGITQKELAGEDHTYICSVRELQRIESGEKSPQPQIMSQLLGVFGKNMSDYEAYLNKTTKMRFDNEYEEITNIIFDTHYKLAKEKCELLKSNGEGNGYYNKENVYYKKHLLCLQATLEMYDGKDYVKAIGIIREALEINLNERLLDEIKKGIPSEKEVILNLIDYRLFSVWALLEFNMGALLESIEIQRYMIKKLKDNSIQVWVRVKVLPYIYNNLAQSLNANKAYEEASLLCDEGIEMCRKSGYMKIIPLIYYKKGIALYHMEDIEGAHACFRMSESIFMQLGDIARAKNCRIDSEEKYKMCWS